MASNVTKPCLNPEAPEFIPKKTPQVPTTSFLNPSTPLYYLPPPPNPVFYFPETRQFPYSPTPIIRSNPPNPSPNPNPSPLTSPVNNNQPTTRRSSVVKKSQTLVHQKYRRREGCSTSSGHAKSYKDGKEGFNRVKKFSDGSESRRKQKHRNPVVPVREDGDSTTVMIRNIPCRYTREMLMEFLDRHCLKENKDSAVAINPDDHHETSDVVSAFDFLYLPIDFNKGMNKGYAFVNFTTTKAVWKFYLATNNQTWEYLQSHKIRQIASARLQGKEELVRHFEKMAFPCEREQVLPVCFSPPRDGSNKELVKQTTVGRRLIGQIRDQEDDDDNSNQI